MEQQQVTGSFKLRGASNKIFSLLAGCCRQGRGDIVHREPWPGRRGGRSSRGVDAEIFPSSQVPEAKWKKIASYGARIQTVGENPLDAELAARAAADASGRTYISPYNDWQVVAGQGTIAVELLRQVGHYRCGIHRGGGGGLVSGIGSYLRARSPHTEVVGCWPENSRVLYECMQAGRIIDVPESYTLSESTAGGVEPGSITFELARKAIHRSVLVSEAAILDAMLWARQRDWTIEGSAAVALAALFQDADRYEGKSVVVVFCGGNLSPEVESRLHELRA